MMIICSQFRILRILLQNLFSNLMRHDVQQSSESQSEASSSVGSDFSDFHSVALQMGLPPGTAHEERFKVDRQKLENMIKSNVQMLFL